MHVGRGCTFLRHGRTRSKPSFHVRTHGGHLAAHRHAQRVIARGRQPHAEVPLHARLDTGRGTARPARQGHRRRWATRSSHAPQRLSSTSASTVAPRCPSRRQHSEWTDLRRQAPGDISGEPRDSQVAPMALCEPQLMHTTSCEKWLRALRSSVIPRSHCLTGSVWCSAAMGQKRWPSSTRARHL